MSPAVELNFGGYSILLDVGDDPGEPIASRSIVENGGSFGGHKRGQVDATHPAMAAVGSTGGEPALVHPAASRIGANPQHPGNLAYAVFHVLTPGICFSMSDKE
jgi:hypothetical protein